MAKLSEQAERYDEMFVSFLSLARWTPFGHSPFFGLLFHASAALEGLRPRERSLDTAAGHLADLVCGSLGSSS